MRTSPSNLAKRINPLFSPSPPHTSWRRKALRVLGWSVLTAGLAALTVGVSALVGALAPAAGASVGMRIGKEALVGAAEGLLFAALAEYQGKRMAAALTAPLHLQQPIRVRKLSIAAQEAHMRSVDAQLENAKDHP
jgi:hypothetical protein